MNKLLIRIGLSIACSASLFLTCVALHAQPVSSTVEGILQVVWGDPHPELSQSGETRYSLITANGAAVTLDVSGQESVATSYFGKRVTVSGRAAPGSGALPNSSTPSKLMVDTIQLTKTVQGPTPNIVAGTKKVIYLLVRFSDDVANNAIPHPPSFYTNLNNPDTPPAGEQFPATVNGFFKKTSWGLFSWIGDVGGVGGVGASGGWLILPHPKSYYANCGWDSTCAQLTALGDDATALGRAQGINFVNYDNINFVLSNDLDCCAWGGGYYSSIDAKNYGATWEPPWGQEAGTYAHEMGHSLGLPHSGWVYSAYDSPWDMMSNRTGASNLTCGSYTSKNSSGARTLYCSEPGDGYSAPYKDYLGWIPFANTAVITPGAATTVTLEGSALPLSTSAKILKIGIPGYPLTGSTARYFTVEARVGGLGTTSQYDNGLAGEGIIIHEFRGDRPAISGPCFFNSQSGWALPIDATPGDWDPSPACSGGSRVYPNYALNNAQWNVGQTYTNNTYAFSVTVVSRSGSNFVVSVQNGISPPGPPTIVAITPGLGQVTISFTAPASTGGAPIVSYTASCSAPSMPTKTVTGSSSPLVVTGLTGGVAYSCTVSANNGSFSSAASVAWPVTPGGSTDLTPILMLLLLD